MKILKTWVVYLFLILIFNSCGEPVPVACTPDEEECATEREGGFETGPVAGIAAGGAAVIALAGGGLSSDDGGQSSSNSESADENIVSVGSSCNFAGGTVPNGGNVIAFRNDTVAFGESCASQRRICSNGQLSGSYAYKSCYVDACFFDGDLYTNGQSVVAYQNVTVPLGSTCVSQTRTCNNGYLSGSYSFSTCNEAKPMACFFNNSTLQHGDSIAAYATASVLEGGNCLSQIRTCQNGVLSGSYNFKVCEEQNECVYYIGDFNTVTGIFQNQWYQRDSEGVPIYGSSIFDDDAAQFTIPSILADDGYVISGTQPVTLVTGGTISANIIRGPSGCGQIFMGENQEAQTYWPQQLGSSNSGTRGISITSDFSDNVYVSGETYGDLDGNISAGMWDLFVVKYNINGVKQWTRQLGTTGFEIGGSITSDFSGNVYVTGSTSGNLDGNTNAGSNDLFVAKYNSAGIKQWTRQLGTSFSDGGNGITSDSSGNVYVTGSTSDGLDGNTNAGDYDFFVVKYNSAGVKQWTQQMGSANDEFGNGITSDSSGNVYVTGNTYGGLDGNTGDGNRFRSDLFVVKYDSDGIKQWTQQLGSSSSNEAYGITTDSNGNVYVTGSTSGNLDGNTNAGSNDLFVAKYNSAGIKQWTRQLGTSFSDGGNGITSDSSGNVYVTGGTNGGLDGNTNAGSNDLFVVKYNSAGVKQWTQQMGSAGDEIGNGITSDSLGNVYVTGYATGGLYSNSITQPWSLFVVKYNSNGILQQ